jgi:hypothetical protein
MVICCLAKVHAQTYELQIDSLVGIPEEIVDGEEITFFMIVSMNSPLFYQGNIFVELEYGGNFYQVDSTQVAAGPFLSPNTPNTLQVTHRVSTEDDLSIGDNVVVVWPRIGDGINNPPQEVVNPQVVTLTIVEPNGIPTNPERIRQSFINPNPAITSIRYQIEDDVRIEKSILYDMRGRILAETGGEMHLDISHLPAGIYFVDVLTEEGHVYSDKLLITR